MKKLLLITAILFFAISAFSQSRADITSAQDGDWSQTSTWTGGVVPSSGDNVTIDDSVYVTDTRASATITVNSGAALDIGSGATLSTSGNVTINGTLYQNGTLNAGSAVTNHLTIDGGTFDVGNGSTTNVAGYYSMINNATVQASASSVTANVNIATQGALNDNTNSVLSFQSGSTADFQGATVNFWVKDGNDGTAPDISIGYPGFTSSWNGKITFGSGGSTTVTDWTAEMEKGTGFYWPVIDVGSGNTFHLVQTTFQAGTHVHFTRMDLNSGNFIIEPLADVMVTNSTGINMNGGTLEINSDATGTGELIFNGTTTTPATVNQYIVGQQWHQISPTTDNLQTSDIFQNYSPNVWLMEYDVANQKWVYMDTVAPLDTTLQVGHGYIVFGKTLSRVDDFTFTYTGNLRSTDLGITGIGSNLDDLQLIGNPFSSSYDVTNALSASGTNLYQEIWVWDPVNDQYATYTVGSGGSHNGKVANGQGFFVETNNATGGGSITLAAADRDFNISDNFFKKSDNNLLNWDNNYGKGIYAMIKVSDGVRTDAAFVNFGENGTPDFENGYDGKKMFGGADAPQLYFVENDIQLSVDYLKTMDFNEARVVRMNLQPGITGEHTLAINLDSLPGTQVTLKDLFTGTTLNFNEDPFYTFTANKGDDPARFELHFNYNATGIENPEETAESSVKIYAWDKAVYISNSDNDFAEATINVYDLMGRKLVSTQTRLGNLTRIPVQVSNSYLVVQVVKDSNVVTEKVFIK